MYGIYAYIRVDWGFNVGIYGIHGVSGPWVCKYGGNSVSGHGPTVDSWVHWEGVQTDQGHVSSAACKRLGGCNPWSN